MAAAMVENGAGGGSVGRHGRAVILLGAPGAGKGTQAKRISDCYHLPHLSTGDMFRDNIRRNTELGQRAKPIMERGELVPDEIVLSMVEDRITRPDCQNGFVFDGFPRTIAQADALEQICRKRELASTVVIYLEVEADVLLRRLTGRRICKTGGHIYNIYDHPPKREGLCDVDGSELIQRPDDSENVIRERLLAYNEQTLPLVKYYGSRGMLVSVDAMADADTVSKDIKKVLDGAEVPK